VVTTDDRWHSVLDGSAPLDWDLWSSPIGASNALTDEGKAAVHQAVRTITTFLGATWLSTFTAPDRRPERHTGVPLLSVYWWPFNDSTHVYRRILEFAARLSILEGASGFAQVRRDMRSDLGHFEHGLLQLEVGGLAMRSGWEVQLEPVPRPPNRAKTDLRLVRGRESMLRLAQITDALLVHPHGTGAGLLVVLAGCWHGLSLLARSEPLPDPGGFTIPRRRRSRGALRMAAVAGRHEPQRPPGGVGHAGEMTPGLLGARALPARGRSPQAGRSSRQVSGAPPA